MLCRGEELRPYLEGALGAAVGSPAEFIGKLDAEGRVVSVAGFTHWCGTDVEVSLVSDGRLRRDFIRRVFAFVFDELGCTRCTCRVAESNAWHEELPRLGFVLEGRLRESFADGDMLIYGMLKRECRFYG